MSFSRVPKIITKRVTKFYSRQRAEIDSLLKTQQQERETNIQGGQSEVVKLQQ
jgi:hypothetical protein